MKIIRDKQLATLTFVPVKPDEEQVIASITAMLKPEDKLSYGGCQQDEAGRNRIVHLHAVGGIELVLQGSTEEDKQQVGSIRDTCYFGSGGLIFIGETEVDGKKSIITIAKRCKYCNAGMIRYSDCEWNTCDVCAAKCEHNYVLGAIHGGGTDIGAGEFCDKCGRGKPQADGERWKTVIEHHLAVEKRLGIKVLYKDGFPGTPRQAVEINRLARRYSKSRRRKAG